MRVSSERVVASVHDDGARRPSGDEQDECRRHEEVGSPQDDPSGVLVHARLPEGTRNQQALHQERSHEQGRDGELALERCAYAVDEFPPYAAKLDLGDQNQVAVGGTHRTSHP